MSAVGRKLTPEQEAKRDAASDVDPGLSGLAPARFSDAQLKSAAELKGGKAPQLPPGSSSTKSRAIFQNHRLISLSMRKPESRMLRLCQRHDTKDLTER